MHDIWYGNGLCTIIFPILHGFAVDTDVKVVHYLIAFTAEISWDTTFRREMHDLMAVEIMLVEMHGSYEEGGL